MTPPAPPVPPAPPATPPSQGSGTAIPKHVDGSQPITFFRLICDVKAGTKLGHYYGGLSHVPRLTYTLVTPGAFLRSTGRFKEAATEELGASGFDVLGGESQLFGQDNSAKARFQLGATLKSVTLDSYDPLAGNRTQSSIEVEWQLRDAFLEKIVLTNTTSGFGSQPGVVNEYIVYTAAFRDALVKLIATSRLTEIVAKNAKDDAPGTSLTNLIEVRNFPPATPLLLPADMDQAMQGVVMIKSGTTLSSGFIVSPDGYILTAAHCVSGVDEVQVVLKAGIKLTARVIRVDGAQDVALIKLSGDGYKCLELNLNKPEPVGNDVYAVGAPISEELAFSVTKGIVSGYRERETDKARFIQTDASLNRGNSGGPMLDHSAKVVGIVSWKIVSPGFEGLSFGVPLDVVGKRLGITWVQKTQ